MEILFIVLALIFVIVSIFALILIFGNPVKLSPSEYGRRFRPRPPGFHFHDYKPEDFIKTPKFCNEWVFSDSKGRPAARVVNSARLAEIDAEAVPQEAIQ